MPIRFNKTERYILMKKAGLSRQLLDAYERGECLPGKKNAIIIAEYTGRDLLDVLYGRDPAGTVGGKK